MWLWSVRDGFEIRWLAARLLHPKADAPDDAAFRRLHVHAPVPRHHPLLDGVAPVALLAPACDRDCDPVRRREVPARMSAVLPAMKDRRVQSDRGEHGSEAIGRALPVKGIV